MDIFEKRKFCQETLIQTEPQIQRRTARPPKKDKEDKCKLTGDRKLTENIEQKAKAKYKITQNLKAIVIAIKRLMLLKKTILIFKITVHWGYQKSQK